MNAFETFFRNIICWDLPFHSPPSTTVEVAEPPRSVHDIYELGDIVGSGGNAVVRLGTNIRTQEKVAIKIAKRAELDPRKESAMKREFEILRALRHPNIVKAIGLYEEAQNYYVVLEYMKGGELFDRIVKKTQYSEKEARDVVRCILSAVEYFHNHDIVHRDLKPENLLMLSEADDSVLKVADFGLAKTIEGNGVTMMSRAGTPEYWAPEILEANLCGKPVDIWAVGIICFVLLGGYTPFHSKSRSTLFDNIRRAEVNFHPKRWSGVSEEAKSFISALLVYDPVSRLTATQALQHPWMASDDELLAQQNLTENLNEFRKYNAGRKFRAGIQAITALNKLKKIGQFASTSNSSSPATLPATEPSNVAGHIARDECGTTEESGEENV